MKRLLTVLTAVALAPGLAYAEAAANPIVLPPGPTEYATAITTLVVFVALLAVLAKFAWGPIVGGLIEREKKIRKDISDAEEARAKSEKLLKEYEAKLAAAEDRVREIINKGAADAEKVAASIKMNAQQDAEAIKERALKDIESSKLEAIESIYAQAAVLSTDIAAKIIRRELRPEDQKDLVARSLGQLGTVGTN